MPDDWFDAGGHGSTVDVAALFDNHAADAIWELVALGALVSIGRTSDGGAVGVTVTLDGRWRREYFRDADDLLGWMAEALPAVRDAAERLAASPARRKRQRGL